MICCRLLFYECSSQPNFSLPAQIIAKQSQAKQLNDVCLTCMFHMLPDLVGFVDWTAYFVHEGLSTFENTYSSLPNVKVWEMAIYFVDIEHTWPIGCDKYWFKITALLLSKTQKKNIFWSSLNCTHVQYWNYSMKKQETNNQTSRLLFYYDITSMSAEQQNAMEFAYTNSLIFTEFSVHIYISKRNECEHYNDICDTLHSSCPTRWIINSFVQTSHACMCIWYSYLWMLYLVGNRDDKYDTRYEFFSVHIVRAFFFFFLVRVCPIRHSHAYELLTCS